MNKKEVIMGPHSPVSASWLQGVVKTFVAESRENTLGPDIGEKAFDAPLVGFSSGADPLYLEYRSHVGSFYLVPHDFFSGTFSAEATTPDDLVVISWIIPSTKKTRDEQAGQKKYPSKRWVRTRALGEEFNNGLRRHLVEQLALNNVQALAPQLSSLWSRYDEGPFAPCSNWSERHAAYAAGLGSFGLCDGLITPVGKAVRIGSVIARLNIPASPRSYSDHHAHCLHYSHDTCRECIARCPVGGLSKSGHDKQKCMAYTEKVMNRYIQKQYGLDTYACGLCQAGVACTFGIPETGRNPDHGTQKEDGHG